MSTALVCDNCQKKFTWKAQYAGRRVQCPCGQVMRMPASDPAAAAEAQASPLPAFDLESPPPASHATATKRPTLSSSPADQGPGDTFELAIETEPPPPPPPPSSALAAALSARPSAVAQALESREDEYQPSPLKEQYLPAAIAIGGTLAMVLLWFIFATSTKQALMGAGGMFVAQVLLMPIAVGAVILIARVMNISLGPTLPSLVKLAAIAIGSGGVADILFFKMMLSVEFDYQMLLVAFVLHMILLGLPVLVLLELELGEMVAIVAIIVVPRIAILYGMGAFFPHWF